MSGEVECMGHPPPQGHWIMALVPQTTASLPVVLSVSEDAMTNEVYQDYENKVGL
jgi:hypothetical protein